MNQFLFGTFPYIALTILILGSVARYERDPMTWKSSSSQLLRRRMLMWGSVLFHVGVLVVFFGHLFGLLIPVEFYDALGVKHEWKQALAAIGGGIAGASLARAFARRGIPPVLLDPDPDLARAASGNPAGLIMPKPDLQDRPESRFYHQAYLYGRRVYEPTGQVFGKGVIQIARTRAEQTRFEKLVINQALPPDELSLLTHSQAEERIGQRLAGGFGALFAAGALQISPKAIAQALRAEADHVPGRATSLAQAGELWQVSLEDGTALEADHVFVCAGAEVPDLLNLDVRFTRGQLIWGRAARRPELAMMCGEYVLPFDGQLLIGATHEQTGPGQDTRIDPARTQALQRAAQAMFETDLDFTPTQARTSVRVTTRNTLPIAAQIKPGLSVLTGLGSRGFLLAPLLGEYLAAKALSEPSPVDIRTQKRFAGQFVP